MEGGVVISWQERWRMLPYWLYNMPFWYIDVLRYIQSSVLLQVYAVIYIISGLFAVGHEVQ